MAMTDETISFASRGVCCCFLRTNRSNLTVTMSESRSDGLTLSRCFCRFRRYRYEHVRQIRISFPNCKHLSIFINYSGCFAVNFVIRNLSWPR
jgi:hypothetical protein